MFNSSIPLAFVQILATARTVNLSFLFFDFVKEVKITGIAENLKKASSAQELKEAWKAFKEKNKDLLEKIDEWKEVYENFEKNFFLVEENEKIEDVLEICIVIYIIYDCFVSEIDLFPINLGEELLKKEDVSELEKNVAELMEEKYICFIQATDIFPNNIIYFRQFIHSIVLKFVFYRFYFR